MIPEGWPTREDERDALTLRTQLDAAYAAEAREDIARLRALERERDQLSEIIDTWGFAWMEERRAIGIGGTSELHEELCELRLALAKAEWRASAAGVAARIIIKGCERSGLVNGDYRVVSVETIKAAQQILRATETKE